MPISLQQCYEAASAFPLPNIHDAQLERDRWHCRYNTNRKEGINATSAEDRAGVLEWAGDSILSFYVVSLVRRRLPTATARFAAALKIELVCNLTLSKLAEAYGLQNGLVPPATECTLKRHPKLLANCLEATLGAAYESGNADGVKEWVDQVLGRLLDEIQNETRETITRSLQAARVELVRASSEASTTPAIESPEGSGLTETLPLSTASPPESRPPHTAKHIFMAESRSRGLRCDFRQDRLGKGQTQYWRTSLIIEGHPTIFGTGTIRVEADAAAAREAVRTIFPQELHRVLPFRR